MILYYTGALDEGKIQTEPRISLGNHVSGSIVPNASLNNLFGEISDYALDRKVTEYRAVALKNTTGAVVSGAQLYYQNISTSPIVNIRMAVVILQQDNCGWYMEKIPSSLSKPLYATFLDNRELINAISLPDINPDEYIGIWIERSFNANAVAAAHSCAALIAAYQQEPINQIATITTIADVADSLHETYWFLNTPDNGFFIWYDTGGGTMPVITNREPIRIAITTGDSADTIAALTAAQLNSILTPRGELSATVLLNVITITNTQPGLSSAPTAQTSGFTASVVVAGASGEQEHEENIALTVVWP